MQLTVQQFGPVSEARLEPGDLTVLVGPQATGKSLLLELFKLLIDRGAIRQTLRDYNLSWQKTTQFVELYFGEGLGGLIQPDTKIIFNKKAVKLERLLKHRAIQKEQVFYIPAQRVMSLRDGITRPFTDFRPGDPFVVRQFSETLHRLVQTEFVRQETLFPQQQRFNKVLRDAIAAHIFGDYRLETSIDRMQRRFVLRRSLDAEGLPFLVWSAGQREFTPLLLGFYWLIPAGKVSRRNALKWVIVEEPEMGLHPRAITTVVLLLLELLRRGYRVLVSTHAPHVLDVIWALRVFQKYGGTERDVRRLFELKADNFTRTLAQQALDKTYRVYFFGRSGAVQDISELDPGAERPEEAGWGGLTEFSGHVGDLVAEVVTRHNHKKS
ncbi:MAG: AAA family ATPase [Rhodothermus sp.]|nr:AAA family ATPase [Rhodothermus sp.]